jgi:hypothetical protein
VESNLEVMLADERNPTEHPVKMDLTNCGSDWDECFLQLDVIIKDKMNVFFFVNTLTNH